MKMTKEMRPADPMEDINQLIETKAQGLDKTRRQTEIISPKETILNYEENATVLREDGTIETQTVTKVREYADGAIISPDGNIIAVRCQNRKCNAIVPAQNYYQCGRCGRYHCRICVKQKGNRYFCTRCWKILTFFFFLQKKYQINRKIKNDAYWTQRGERI